MRSQPEPFSQEVLFLLEGPDPSTLFDGDFVPEVHIFGQTVDLWVSPYTEETNRRAAAGVGAILDEHMIRTMMALPEEVPIELRSLDGGALLAMEGLLEAHAVEVIGDNVRRRAIPPVDLVGIAKAVREWSDMRGLALLGKIGPRVAVAATSMARRIMREIDPEIGVAVVEGPDFAVLRPPGARAVRPSWQRWAIAEAAYDRWRDTRSSDR